MRFLRRDDEPRQHGGAGYVRLEGGYGDGPELGVRLQVEAATVIAVGVYVVLAVALGNCRAVVVVIQCAAPCPMGVRSAATKIQSIGVDCLVVCKIVAV